MKADKGNMTVIMNKQNYDKKIFEMWKMVRRMKVLKDIRLQNLKNC